MSSIIRITSRKEKQRKELRCPKCKEKLLYWELTCPNCGTHVRKPETDHIHSIEKSEHGAPAYRAE